MLQRAAPALTVTAAQRSTLLTLARRHPRHRDCSAGLGPEGGAILPFLSAIDREVPIGLAVRLVLDNDTTHRDPAVRGWLEEHPRFQLLFTPTTYSWLTLVEAWFRELTAKAARGSFNSVPELIAAIEEHTTDSRRPEPFAWTSTTDRILEKLGGNRGRFKIAVGQ